MVSELTGRKSENPLPNGQDSVLAENFADSFLEKIKTIRDSLKQFPNYEPKMKRVESLDHFDKFSEYEVKKLICEMSTKSSELDILPTHLLKSYLQDLLPAVTKLVNLSIEQGIFPTKYKQAIIRPLLKKLGLELELANYRPVSNLSFLGKLIEKAVLYRLNIHNNANSLLPKNQSAYRRHHSCESALIRLVNDILGGMERQEVTAMIAIDLSAAFDTVDHDILLDVLNRQYGLKDTALSWVNSYLRSRFCRVSVNSAKSSIRPLLCSVPQGSCLGPWLYLAYAGTLFDIIPSNISLYGYADDHIASTRFRTSPSSESRSILDLENCAIEINNWMDQNKLKMNTSKTEFIMFGSSPQINKCTTTHIDIAGENIECKSYIRYLGAFLDQNLTLKDHVKHKCRSAMINYLKIKSVRKYLDRSATEILLLSLVISHLDYCNAILYGIAVSELQKMQRIQNMCAKLILNRSKYDSSSQALYDLHWLPIKYRIEFKILCFMYNCHMGTSPEYLIELLSKPEETRPGLRSGTDDCLYNVPFNKRKTFSDRSFGTVGPRLWNGLPLHVRKSESLEIFKSRLKTFYFRKIRPVVLS